MAAGRDVRDAVSELITSVYPDQLIQIAPPGEADRQQVISWFQMDGLGKGSAGNKTATCLLLSSPSPNEAPQGNGKSTAVEAAVRSRAPRKRACTSTDQSEEQGEPAKQTATPASSPKRSQADNIPLNINVQIHISADAGTEQIESIFQAMRRYLYDAPTA